MESLSATSPVFPAPSVCPALVPWRQHPLAPTACSVHRRADFHPAPCGFRATSALPKSLSPAPSSNRRRREIPRCQLRAPRVGMTSSRDDQPLFAVPLPPRFSDPAGDPDHLADHLLVVYNSNDPDSRALAFLLCRAAATPAGAGAGDRPARCSEEITRDRVSSGRSGSRLSVIFSSTTV